MGNFSRDTYDRIKHYVGVRLQQGVPLVDADWNEQEDIKKYELQTFLRWFVGNGVPRGNDGFRIARAPGTDNDVMITGGDGTPAGAGYCLVEGWDVMNESNLNYTAQPLFDNAALAADWGVPVVPPLTTPIGDRTDAVYLDVWEREVDSGEDGTLVNPLIGLETCVRVKREWVVRVAENASSLPAAPAGHVFYHLATLRRSGAVAAILAPHIEDRRLTGLTIGSWQDTRQIVRDTFGDGYTLDHDGEPKLKVNLRDAINALLQGGVPMTAPAPVTVDAAHDYDPVAVRDNAGDIWVFWYSIRGGNNDIWYNRYLSADNAWEGDTQLTTDAGHDYLPRAVVDGDGDVWVFWRSARGGNNDIWYNRYSRASGAWGGDQQLTTHTSSDLEASPVVDLDGNVWAFWYSNRSGNNDIWYNRHDRVAGTWGADQQLTTDAGQDYVPRAVVDGEGDIWVFWYSSRSGNNDIWYNRRDRVAGTWGSDIRLTFDAGSDHTPYSVADAEGDVWVFWISSRSGNSNIWYRRHSSASNSWSSDTQLTTATGSDNVPIAMADANGDVWVVWHSNRSGNWDVWYNHFSRATGWSGDRPVTTYVGTDYMPYAVDDGDGDIWVFWRSLRSGNYDIWYRKLIPEI
jgi:hypothetical protein